jgi:hypothetical protein
MKGPNASSKVPVGSNQVPVELEPARRLMGGELGHFPGLGSTKQRADIWLKYVFSLNSQSISAILDVFVTDRRPS